MGKYYKTTGCTHEDAELVFKVNKHTSMWAGAKTELLDRSGWALVISAVGFSEFTVNPLTTTPSAREVLPAPLFDWTPPACVGITWPDRGVPALDREWWVALAKALPEVKGNIAVCCMGGHGRTGVMLAVLAVLLGKVRKGDCPVAWVRKRYCRCAVESEAQLDYVEMVTQRKVYASASEVKSALPLPTVSPTLGLSATPTLGAGAKQTWAEDVRSGVAGTNPTDLITAPGSGDGVVRGDNPLDADLLDAWFKADGDVITTIDALDNVEYLVPIWDKGGDHVGWREATAEEMAE